MTSFISRRVSFYALKTTTIATYIILIGFFILPLVYIVLITLQQWDVMNNHITNQPLSLISYTRAWAEGINIAIYNSSIISTSTAILVMTLSIICVFDIIYTYYHKPSMFTKAVVFILTCCKAIPHIFLLLGFYVIISYLEWYDTHYGLIFIYTLTLMPAGILLIYQIASVIPQSIYEAAIIDGASKWRLFLYIFLPMIFSRSLMVFIITLLGTWHELLFALCFTSTPTTRTIPVAIAMMGGANQYETEWPIIMAAGIISVLPIMLIFSLYYKYCLTKQYQI